MGSKQLSSILNNVPSATVKDELANRNIHSVEKKVSAKIDTDRLVATIPKQLKDEIKAYLKERKGETEKTVVLKALKQMGFNIDNAWLVDKRSTR